MVKFDVMQRALATGSKVNMGYERTRVPSLLDSGSQVTLIHLSYFEREILPHIVLSSEENAEAHQLFQLTVASNGRPPMSMYVNLDFDSLGIMISKVGLLIT